MKPTIIIKSYDELMLYLKDVTKYSLEISNNGLLITSIELDKRLLIELENVSILNNKLFVFKNFFKAINTSSELDDYMMYVKDATFDSNMPIFKEKQITIFNL